MRENRAGLELEGSRAAVVRLDHHAADDVGRHQVGRELNARVAQMQDAAERPKQSGFAQARNAFEQDVAACHQADQDAIDNILLANDDLPISLRTRSNWVTACRQADVVLHVIMVTPPRGKRLTGATARKK